jgi:3',5'-cyclic AMP phosphodiesterase CpdA
MLIAHVSDFHVFSDKPETALVRLDAEAVARRVAEDLARFSPALDGVALTGDLTDGGSEQDYALLRDILSPIQCPIYIVPGNHDKRVTLRSAFDGVLPFGPGRFLNYEERLGNLRILALDTLIEGRGDGSLEAESLDWIGERLSQATSDPTVILLHHPPFPCGMASLDKASLGSGQAELARMVKAYDGPLLILAGHIHRPYKAMWNGAYCAVGGSPAFQFDLDFSAVDRDPACVREPYAYTIYRMETHGNFAAHTRYVALD